MPQDYFDDSPEPKATGKPKDESSDDQTFVLPKSIAGGKKFKPGDEMVVQIVAEHEDSFEVKYAPETTTEEPEPDSGDTAEATETEEEPAMPMKEGADSMMD